MPPGRAPASAGLPRSSRPASGTSLFASTSATGTPLAPSHRFHERHGLAFDIALAARETRGHHQRRAVLRQRAVFLGNRPDDLDRWWPCSPLTQATQAIWPNSPSSSPCPASAATRTVA